MTIDPGEHIGIIYDDNIGETIKGDDRNKQLWELLQKYQPDVIIFEEFSLRQSSAIKLVGNKFVTCEVIGVIKLYCQLTSATEIPLMPGNKEYCGFSSKPSDYHYQVIDTLGQKITEHVRDAFRLFNYAKLFKRELL